MAHIIETRRERIDMGKMEYILEIVRTPLGHMRRLNHGFGEMLDTFVVVDVRLDESSPALVEPTRPRMEVVVGCLMSQYPLQCLRRFSKGFCYCHDVAKKLPGVGKRVIFANVDSFDVQ